MSDIINFSNKSRKKSTTKVLKILLSVVWCLWVALMYYLLIPAINIHSVGLWMFVLLVMLVPATANGVICNVVASYKREYEGYKASRIMVIIDCVFVLVLIIAAIAGSRMFNASKYAAILKTEEYNFKEDIDQSNAISKIALMDTDSAILFGNREIGTLSSVVSQYDVSEEYTQIDYKGTPKKVSALEYAGFFKYMGNKEDGVPGYVCVDPVSQNAEYIALEENMKYVPSAFFSYDLDRYLRTKYPTKIFGNSHFEIDEDGKPYYIASVYEYTIGLFGGETVAGVIICNPVDGACQFYKSENIDEDSSYKDAPVVPNWVDEVYEGSLIVEQYNWYGKLSNGFLNSIFGKKGCKKSTETCSIDDDDEEYYESDYGYISKDGDIWIYTGVTSVNDDSSNIGFILVNQRTSEAHYYQIAGADEDSAMSAAEGEVQEKGYKASFPSLVNVDEQPTYVMVLKDASGIVKLYAMVNVESYNIVTTAANLEDCFKKYRKLLAKGSQTTSEDNDDDSLKVDDNDIDDVNVETVLEEFKVTDIKYIDIEGNTYVYLIGDDGNMYKQKFSENEELIYVKAGTSIKAECIKMKERIYKIKKLEVVK